MSKEGAFGQTDVVKLSDEDAAVALLERAVTGLWEVVNQLTRFRRTIRLASEVDFTIPHCVDTIEETVALVRENRAAWLATQTAKQPHGL
jgi:Tat protein secretion system quality control protein TatD with DNase activity